MSEVAVVFRFPHSAEIRYLETPPVPGTRVRTSDGRVWVVDELLASGQKTYTAYCVARQEQLRTPRLRPASQAQDVARPASRAREDLATRLLELANRSIHAPASIRRRYKMRNYIP